MFCGPKTGARFWTQKWGHNTKIGSPASKFDPNFGPWYMRFAFCKERVELRQVASFIHVFLRLVPGCWFPSRYDFLCVYIYIYLLVLFIYLYLKVTSPLGHWIIVFCHLSQPSYLAILWLCVTCQLLEGCICIAAVLISTASFTMSTPQTKSKPCLAKATKFSPEGFFEWISFMPTDHNRSTN